MTPPDLASRLRAIVRPSGTRTPGSGPPRAGRRELTYEPDVGRRHEASPDPDRLAGSLGGRWLINGFGRCLVIDRRYESDRWHGDVQIGDCELSDLWSLRLLDPALQLDDAGARRNHAEQRTSENQVEPGRTRTLPNPVEPGRTQSNPVFIDLETTGVSGGAGTVAFLVGCGYFDLGAFQIRQFLLTSYNAERALLAAVAELFGGADLIVTYNGKTFDLPVMETRWAFHRMRLPLEEVPHFDMLHPARRLWRSRSLADDGGCRLTTLERVLLNLRRVGDVDGFEIPARFFEFLRTADPRPLEPVLEHNRLDLVSLAAVTSHALRLTAGGESACRDGREALAVGRVLERAGLADRAEACYGRAVETSCPETRAEALYRLGLRCRRDRRYVEAAARWRDLLHLTDMPARRGDHVFDALRQFALEALAIHHEHRAGNLDVARELALFALNEDDESPRADGMRRRLARLDRKLARNRNAQLFS
jgi:uncharacterized protein YprB with RNaseH-like and TPR domain